MRRKRTSLASLAGLIAIVLTACGGSQATHQPGHPSPGAATPKPPPPPPPLPAPLIVQVENSSDARPQSGLNQADVVYEYETEGGISRFSAMYFQPPQQPIGPVRSARLVTVKLVQAYDGTLLYSGGSAYVVQALEHTGVRAYSETAAAGALYRINSRAAPHNLYADPGKAIALEQSIGPHTVHYPPVPRTPLTALPPGGQAAPKFKVPVSDSETPIYTYDAATGGYQRTEPDTGLFTDTDTNNGPWEPKNIAVLQVPVTIGPEVEDVSGAHGLDFGIQGSGAGQLAVGGQLYSINWYQSPYGPPSLTLANGRPAPIVPGQVLFELVGTGKTVSG